MPFQRSRAAPTGPSYVLSSALFPVGAQRRCLFEHPPLRIPPDNCSHLRRLTHPNSACALHSCSAFIPGSAFVLFFDSLACVCRWSCRLTCVEACGDGAALPLTSSWFVVKRFLVMHVAHLSAVLSPITCGLLFLFF